MSQIIFTDHRRAARDEFAYKHPEWRNTYDGFVTEDDEQVYICTTLDQLHGIHIDKLYKGPMHNMSSYADWDKAYTQALVCGAEIVE